MAGDLDDDAVIVTLPVEEGGATITKVVTGETQTVTTDPVEDLRGQFETLKGTLAARDQQLVAKDQQIVAKDQEVAHARTQLVESQLDTVTSGLAAAESDLKAAKQEYVAASEAGDFSAQADAQAKIAEAIRQRGRLQEAQEDLKEAKPSKSTTRQETTQQPRQAPSDPVEAVASTMAPRAAAWIRSHPEFITDRSKNAKMMSTHFAALGDGLTEGGDEYFARLDAMATAKPATERKADPEVKTDPTTGKRPTSGAAPSGSAGGGMNGGATEVRLTHREVTAATDGTIVWEKDSTDGKHKRGDPLGIQEFGRRKMIMQKQGHYDKQYTE